MTKVDVLLGLQWGDEGKGKIVDLLAPNYDIIARFQGGPNAGHSLEFDIIKFVTHQIPSGIFHKHIMNVIGNGVVLDPVKFRNEILGYIKANGEKVIGLIEYLPLDEIKKRLIISDEAHFIVPGHKWLDEVKEKEKGDAKIGSTLCGIGPAYEDKPGRVGIRVGEIKESGLHAHFESLLKQHKTIINGIDPTFFETHIHWEEEIAEFFSSIEFLRQFSIQDTPRYFHEALRNDKKILAEGAQGSSLDINFGDYPFVTSSTTISAGACAGLGVPPQAIGEVFGLIKAYCTRVGSGPFPTEQENETGEQLRQKGNEFGATTGRPRRCGWLDLVQIKRAIMLSGVTQLILSKGDVLDNLGEPLQICTSYSQTKQPIYQKFPYWESIGNENALSKPFSLYKEFIEQETRVPITIISNGPDRKDVILLPKVA